MRRRRLQERNKRRCYGRETLPSFGRLELSTGTTFFRPTPTSVVAGESGSGKSMFYCRQSTKLLKTNSRMVCGAVRPILTLPIHKVETTLGDRLPKARATDTSPITHWRTHRPSISQRSSFSYFLHHGRRRSKRPPRHQGRKGR